MVEPVDGCVLEGGDLELVGVIQARVVSVILAWVVGGVQAGGILVESWIHVSEIFNFKYWCVQVKSWKKKPQLLIQWSLTVLHLTLWCWYTERSSVKDNVSARSAHRKNISFKRKCVFARTKEKVPKCFCFNLCMVIKELLREGITTTYLW